MASGAVRAPSPSLVIAAGAAWPPICAAAVILRFYTRRTFKMKLLLDDWLTIPALILTTGMGATLISGVALKALAYPTPAPANPAEALSHSSFQLQTTRQVLWALELLQIPALACVKLSFISFYRRIFCTGHGRIFNIATIVMNVTIIAWTLAFFFALLFACRLKFAAWWTSVEALSTECVNSLDLENAFAISDFIMDLFVYVLPIPVVRNRPLVLDYDLMNPPLPNHMYRSSDFG
jgi:hypothetical protein